MPPVSRFPHTLQIAPESDARGGHGARCDGNRTFAGVSLQQADLRGLDLHGISFRDADARGADFEAANLQGADFTGALAQGASFRRARLDGASFRQALLLSAHLDYATVNGTSFASANLEWAWIEGVDFQLSTVTSALFLNVRGLSESMRRTIENGGGFTGHRVMILGRELDDVPQIDEQVERSRNGSHG